MSLISRTVSPSQLINIDRNKLTFDDILKYE